MSAPVLQLRTVTRVHGTGDTAVHALHDVSLAVRSGDFVAVMGPSGSGKSTLMNILGCLEIPDRGRYFLDGVDVRGLSESQQAVIRSQKIGFVFQGFNLLARTSALENVELPLAYAGVATRDRRERALEALRVVGLADRAGHYPNQMSGGQQQRVAIARGLVTGAPLLLADEPTGNLDSRTSDEVMAILVRMNEERGITVVLVTHEADIAEYARRVIVFRDGLIHSDSINGRRRRPSPVVADVVPDAVTDAAGRASDAEAAP